MGELNSIEPMLLQPEAATLEEWHVIHVKSRVDSFTQEELLNEIREAVAQGRKKIALDLKSNRFLSLPAIKGCVEVSKKLAADSGKFALIMCPERTKRHFEIYGSLKHIRVMRSNGELKD